eukprot:tig00000691_g3184.t1
MAEDEKKATLPLARIKRIMKMDGDVKQVSQEAYALVGKATELFLERFARAAFENTQSEKRKTIAYKDLSQVVKQTDEMEFLFDIIPEKRARGDAPPPPVGRKPAPAPAPAAAASSDS